MTSLPRIDQFVAGFADGDAISTDALLLQEHFRALGCRSEIFVDPGHVSPSMRDRCRDYRHYAGASGDVAVYHFSIRSPLTDLFMLTPATPVLRYHNITPPEYYRGFDDEVHAQLGDARAQLPALTARARAIWPVSRYNATDIPAADGDRVAVLPLLFSPAIFGGAPDPAIARRFPGRQTTWLFVGRIAPNKYIEDLMLAFAWYHRALNANSRLLLVGSEHSCPRYFAMLRMLAGDLELRDICMEGFAGASALAGYYRLADLFVCASRHEGFCLPLVEAMHHGVPVVAHNAGGMPEALDGAGVLYANLEPAELGALCHVVATDPALRAEVLASQARRMAALSRRDVPAELRALLRPFAPALA